MRTFFLGGFYVSPRLTFSGSDMVYLYPDCRTALVGDFGKDGKMVETSLSEVIGTTVSTIEDCLACKELSVIDPRFYSFSDLEVIFLSVEISRYLAFVYRRIYLILYF